MSSDSHIWGFPPMWEFQNLTLVGPVYLQDSMVLTWGPATSSPWVQIYCISASNFGTDIIDYNNIAPPITYRFTTYAQYNGSEDVFCHAIFIDNDNGNTVNWQFINSVAPTPTTWSTVIPSTASSLASPTTSAVSTTPASTRPVPTPTQSPSHEGLTSGASAGIGIGAAIAVLLVALLFVLLFRRAGRKSQERHPTIRPEFRQELSGISNLKSPAELDGERQKFGEVQ